jgi:hypothetical protein
MPLLLLCACDPTSDQIARWKETERGPVRLRATLKKSSLAPALRGQALTALVELGMTHEGLTDLRMLGVAERQGVVHEAVPRLSQLLRDNQTVGSAATRAMREAKDALFELRGDVDTADRERIDRELIAWTTVDLVGRMSLGGHSSEKIRAVPTQ